MAPRERLFLSFLLLLAPVLAAQSPVQPTLQEQPSGQQTAHSADAITTLQVSTKLVVLDVVVTDPQGHIVSGLTKKDFTVLQGGAAQNILNFDSWIDRPLLPDTPALDRFGRPDWGEAPLTIFVLDELNTPFDEKSYAATMLKKYLSAQPALLAAPAMLMVVNDYGYHPLTAYTRDRELLLNKLASRPPAIPAKLTMGQNDVLLQKSFALLRQIALASEGLREHKSIVWIGRGFPSLDPASLSNKSQDSLQAAIKDTVTLLLEARVTVYKVDPMPTTTQLATTDTSASTDLTEGAISTSANLADFGETPQADNFNFNHFALATGGQYFVGLNDLNRFIQQSVTFGSEFYTLSYKPPPATVDGAFLNIRIKMNKPGLVATTRQGYYASDGPKPPPTADELGFDLGLAAVGQMQYDGVSAHVTSITRSPNRGMAAVTLQIEDRTLHWDSVAGGSVSDFIVVLVGLDAKHQVVSSAAYKMHPLMAAKDNALLSTGLLTVRDDIELTAKTRFVRVLVRDSSGRIGTADVETSQLNDLLNKMPAASPHRR